MSTNIPRSKSRILLLGLSILGLSVLFFLFSLSPHSNQTHFQIPNPNTKTETSFVASLEHFLTHKAPQSSSSGYDTVKEGLLVEEEVKKFDNGFFNGEMDRLYRDPYFPVSMPLKIYVYNMPSKFTYDLLWLFRNTYKQTSNLTSNGSPVHRLIEQVLSFCRFSSSFFLFNDFYLRFQMRWNRRAVVNT